MGIKTKSLMISLLLALAPLTAAGVSAYYYSIGALTGTTIHHLEYELVSKADDVEKFMSGIHKDVIFLAGAPDFQDLVGYRGPGNSMEYMRLRKKVENELLAFSKTRAYYYQLRHINEQGYETVRVDSDEGVSRIYPEDKLQYKGDRYYFQESMKYAKGQCYVSKMDLNVELGKVEVPHKPVIRIATPIYDSAGVKRGIVIINLYANYLLRQLKTFNVAKGGITFMVNKDGFYVSHFDSDDRMDAAYNIGTAEKLGKDYSPGVAGKILSGAPGTVQTDNSVISYAPIHTGDEVVNDYWVLAIVYPKKYILGSVWKLEMVFAVLGILSVGIATGIGLWTAKRYTGPILELHQGVEWIAAGDFDHMLRISTGDEIEDLAKRFNEMAGRLKIAKEEMEKWNLKLAHEVSVRSRELVRERNKFESVIMSAEEGIIVADENDGITIVNPRAETIMKAHKADLIGKNLYGYYKDIENTQLAKGEVKDAAAPRTAVIGSLLIETSWAVIGNRGEKAGTMVVMRDISERQRLMEERLTMERQLLLADKLVDYVAMDIKGPRHLWANLTGNACASAVSKAYGQQTANAASGAAMLESMEIVTKFPNYEFRTTIAPVVRGGDDISFLTVPEMAIAAKMIIEVTGSADHKYYVQKFVPRKDGLLDKRLESFPETPPQLLEEIKTEVLKYLPKCQINLLR